MKLICILLAVALSSCSTYMVHGTGPAKNDPAKTQYSTGTIKHYGGAGSLGTWVTKAPALPADSNYSIKTTQTFGQVLLSICNFGFFNDKTLRVYVKK